MLQAIGSDSAIYGHHSWNCMAGPSVFIVLISVGSDYDIILPQHSRLFCWDCSFSLTTWWWYLVCYPQSSFKKATGLFSAIEIEVLANEKQNEKFYVFDVEDITSLNTKSSLCPSIAHTLLPSLISAYACQSVFICGFIGLHTYSPVDVQTNIFAHMFFCKRLQTFSSWDSHLTFLFQERVFPPWEQGFAISSHLQFTRSFSCACLMRSNNPNGSVIFVVPQIATFFLPNSS